MSLGSEQDFVQWEMASRDTIDVKRIYIVACDDIVYGVWFSQFLFYFLPWKDATGVYQRHPKLIFLDNEWWLPMQIDEWLAACCVKRKQYGNCIAAMGQEVDRNGQQLEAQVTKNGPNKLASKKFVLHRNTFLNNKKTPILRPNWPVLLSVFNDLLVTYEIGQRAKPHTADQAAEGAEADAESEANAADQADNTPSAEPNSTDYPKSGQSVVPPENESAPEETIAPNRGNQLPQIGIMVGGDYPKSGQSVTPNRGNLCVQMVPADVSLDTYSETEGATPTAAEESNDSLPSPAPLTNPTKQNAQTTKTSSISPRRRVRPQPAPEPTLPQMGAVPELTSAPSSGVADIAQRLCELAERQSTELTSDEALSIAATFDETHEAKPALVKRIGGGYKTALLSEAVGQPMRDRIAADADDLRWMLISWRGYEESQDKYYSAIPGKGKKTKWKVEDKTRIFLAKWQSEDDPPATWLQSLLRDYRKQLADQAWKVAQATADEFWRTLNAGQQQFAKAVIADVYNQRYRSVTGDLTDIQNRQLQARVVVLNDATHRQAILDAPAVAVATVAASIQPNSLKDTAPSRQTITLADVQKSLGNYGYYLNRFVRELMAGLEPEQLAQKLLKGGIVINRGQAEVFAAEIIRVWQESKVKAA